MRRWRKQFRLFQIATKLKLLLTTITMMLFLLTPYAFADGLIRFVINKQRADKALISFAQKANQTIVFSFDLTKKHQANGLKGYYSVKSGLKKLLNGTGLIAVVNNSGQLSIQADKHDRKTTTMKKTTIAALVPVLLGTASQTALAEEAALTEQKVESISVIGSRVAGRSADDLPVPVDILSAEALANTGQIEVGRMLQAIAPSFNFSSSAISDGTDALRAAPGDPAWSGPGSNLGIDQR